jgi:hypothetical protein
MSQAAVDRTASELSAYLGKTRRAGRKRNAPITLPLPREVCEEDRARLSKLRVAVQSDPLGLLTGEFDARPRYGVGDATPERFKHSKSAGIRLVTERETFEDGRPTGLQHKRFQGILEAWRNKNVIDDATFHAAQTFQMECDLALEASPRMISRYGHIMPHGIPELLPQEIQIEFQKRKRAAIGAVDLRLHLVLGWIAEVSNTEVHPDTVAALYFPKLGEKTRIERFKGLLDYVCMLLSVHYGQTDDKRHRWVRLAISRAAAEVDELLRM